MGFLGRLFGAAIGRIVAFFGAYISTKLALFLAASATFVAMLAALTLAFNSALTAISQTIPAEYQWGLGIIPSNVPLCVSTLITARVAIWIFQVKWAIVKIKMQA